MPGTGPPDPRRALLGLTAAKTVVNTGLRWIPPFLSTLETAFATTTSTLTTIMGVGELAGLTTLIPRRYLDRGGERAVMAVGLGLVSVASLLALTGTVAAFALAFFVLIAGVSNFTAAGHAWISHRVAYTRRARSIGVFETSWALALLVGAPIVAVLINRYGWRAPFLVVAIATAIASLAVWVAGRGEVRSGSAARAEAGAPAPRLTRRALATIAGNALMAAAGLSVFVVSGVWMSDELGVSTGGLGAVAMVLGAGELVASGSSAAFADRWGKSRCAVGGAVVLILGLILMANAASAVLGVAALMIFLLGFEFGYVTSFSLVSEALPDARGATIGLAYAIATGAKSAGTIVGGLLYGAVGIGATAGFSMVLAAAAALAFGVAARR